MVKLGWVLVPKVRSYRVSVDYDDIDEMVNRNDLQSPSSSYFVIRQIVPRNNT